MHEIILRSIRFSNVLSYGTNINEVFFKNGITWLSGANGSGKSAVIEALTYALFGKAYRNVPLKELCNASNKSKLTVEAEFDRIDSRGTVSYKINRSMTKSGTGKSFSIAVDNIPLPKTAGMSQKIFEDEVLGFNQNLFQNVISMNTIQTVPFIDMEPKDKRVLIESILTLHIDKYKKLNSSESTRVQTKFNDATNDVVKYTKLEQDLRDILVKLEQEDSDQISDLKADANIIFNEINTLSMDIVTHQSRKQSIADNITVLVKKVDSFIQIETLLVQLKRAIESSAGRDGIIEKIVAFKSKINELSIEITTLQVELDRCNVNSNKLTSITNQRSALQFTIATLTSEATQAKVAMDKAKADNDALVVGVECHTCGKPSTEADIDKVRDSLRVLWKHHNTIYKTKLKELNKLKADDDALSIQACEAKEFFDLGQIALTKQSELKLTLRGHESTLTELENQLSTIDSNVITALSSTSCKSITDLPKEIKKLENKLTKKSLVENELAEARTLLGIATEAISQTQSKKLVSESSYKILSEKIIKKETLNIDSGIARTRTQLEDAIKDRTRAYERVAKYSDEIEVVKYIDRMFGDDGLKKYILSTFVPSLNETIAHNIQLFSLPFSIEFDESLDYKFESNFGMAQVYHGLSQGQKRKLNFAISMAFHDFVSIIAEFKINIMFLDEVLDISTDEEALGDMIMLLKEKLTDIPGIYLMSHRGETFTDYWDHKLSVTHDGCYSSIEENY